MAGYDIYENGKFLTSVPPDPSGSTAVQITGLQPSAQYSFTAKARDTADLVSAASNTLTFTTDSGGNTPTAPGNPHVTASDYTSGTLSWTAAGSGAGSIASYDIYSGSTEIMAAPASVTSVIVGGLTPGTTSSYTVRAVDSSGDISPQSNAVSITTTPLPGGQEISNPTATFTSTTVSFSATYNEPFGFRPVFISTENSLEVSWTLPCGVITAANAAPYPRPSNGADFMIEGAGYTYTWTVNLSDFGANVPWPEPLVFQGDGFAPSAYSQWISIHP